MLDVCLVGFLLKKFSVQAPQDLQNTYLPTSAILASKYFSARIVVQYIFLLHRNQKTCPMFILEIDGADDEFEVE
jgi:hypothetical protein